MIKQKVVWLSDDASGLPTRYMSNLKLQPRDLDSRLKVF